jgi:hypothetical protein
MRRLLLLVLALLASAIPARGQSTLVSGTITDQGGQAWFAGTVQFTFRPANSNPTAQYFWNGAPFSSSTTIPVPAQQLDGSGSFSGISIPSNNFITPSGSTWTVQVVPASTTSAFSQNLTITGATQNISAQIIPPAINLNLSVPLLGARAYTDSEVSGALPGTLYFNNTDNRLHVCLLTGFPPCTWFVLNGGGGTVASFSAGTANPFFTTTVTNPTTTPALAFNINTQNANCVFAGPTSGGPATPTCRALVAADVGSAVVTGVAGTLSEINVNTTCCGFSTGNVTISVPNPFIGSGGVFAAAGFELGFASFARFISPGTNEISMSNGVGNFTRLDIGPNNSGFPALQRNGANLDIELADGSARTGLRAASITDDGLTAGKCVQAGTAGILTTISTPCPVITSTQIESMTFCPSGCTVTGTPCTTANTGNAECTNAITWPTTFADANYAVACQGIGRTNFPFIPFVTKTAGVVTVTTSTGENAAATASSFNEIDCQGNHP